MCRKKCSVSFPSAWFLLHAFHECRSANLLDTIFNVMLFFINYYTIFNIIITFCSCDKLLNLHKGKNIYIIIIIINRKLKQLVYNIFIIYQSTKRFCFKGAVSTTTENKIILLLALEPDVKIVVCFLDFHAIKDLIRNMWSVLL